MISSSLRAPRYGQGRAGGKLIVDGRDETLFRQAEIAFKPATNRQKRALVVLLDATHEVYNACLQERRDAWRHPSRTRIGVFDQFNQVKDLRGVREDVLVGGIQPLRWAMRRVDAAFSAFFRRVKRGEVPGYPRFKSGTRWNTIGYDEPQGWKLSLSEGEAHLYVRGVGRIPLSKSAVRQIRRYLARGGVPTTLTLTRANLAGSAWRAGIGFKDVAVERVSRSEPGSVVGIDRGVAVLLAAASQGAHQDDPGQLIHHEAILVQRLSGIRAEIENLQRQRDSKKTYSCGWRQLSQRIRRLHRKASNLQENWARHSAGELVAAHEVLVLEDLNLKGMTKAAKGTVSDPGTNVPAKSGLNRSLAQATPGKLAKWLSIKAESAGCRLWLVNPAHTSQQCSVCGLVDPASRVNRETYYCAACGHYEHADLNAARNIRARGLAAEQAWQSAGCPSLERPEPRLRRRKATTEKVLQTS